jgi:hypothetical protein
MKADQAALRDLDRRWDEAYDIALTGVGWVAKRLDNGRALVASGPDELLLRQGRGPRSSALPGEAGVTAARQHHPVGLPTPAWIEQAHGHISHHACR